MDSVFLNIVQLVARTMPSAAAIMSLVVMGVPADRNDLMYCYIFPSRSASVNGLPSFFVSSQ